METQRYLDSEIIDEILDAYMEYVESSIYGHVGFLVYDKGGWIIFTQRDIAEKYMRSCCSDEAFFCDLDYVGVQELDEILNDIMFRERKHRKAATI